ncbi:MAG TPA: branched-chain amino acid ABC transporter substrate-binding protein [Solirubrobacteraceae bacterium]|nr:branched-chain amino acid ABC transporter substrate-binding protein [Solirubrobacteraceae bacterium]
MAQRRPGRRRAAPLLAAAGALLLAGCGTGARTDGGSVLGNTLTVYSSLPLQGPARANSMSIVNGEKLALQQAGGMAGDLLVKYVSLDDTGGSKSGWDPGAVATNAREAADDTTTIAYLGEDDSGASAVSIPINNQAGILQVSPTSTYGGLTSSYGAEKGEAAKYYPTAKRNFARLIPNDLRQATAQARYQRAQGCTSTYVLSDRQPYSMTLAANTATALDEIPVKVAGNDVIDPTASDQSQVVKEVRSSGADCVFYAGYAPEGVAALLNALHAGIPDATLFASAGVAVPAVANALDAGAQAATRFTSPEIPARVYSPAGRAFVAAYRRAFGTTPTADAIYGYAAMKGVLDAIRRAGPNGNDRQSVIDAFFALKNHPSVLGTYSIRPIGDSTLPDYWGYRVRGGRLVYDRTIDTRATS